MDDFQKHSAYLTPWKKEKFLTKKNIYKFLLASAAILFVIASLSSCNMGLPWDNALWGTWEVGTSTITIKNDTYAIDDSSSYDWDYGGEIVEYNNHSYNIAAENPSEGEFGFILLKITNHKVVASQIGTYTVIRWKNIETVDGVTTVETSEAYPAGWSSEAEALTGADADHFAIFSSMTKTD
jgi:hypothetical protein